MTSKPLFVQGLLLVWSLILVKPAHAEPPPVHVLMPVYNTGQYIEKSIQSVIEQTYANRTRLILYDDASTDDAIAKAVKLLGDTKVLGYQIISTPINQGRGHARIELAKYSKAVDPEACILWLDSDDYYNDHEFIEKFANVMDETQADICLFSFDLVYEDDSRKHEASSWHRVRNESEAVISFIYNQPNHVALAKDIPGLLDFTTLGCIKGYAGRFELPEPERCSYEDFVSSVALLKAHKITSMPPGYRPLGYLQRTSSLMGKGSAQSFFDALTQLKRFLDLVPDAIKAERKDEIVRYMAVKLERYRGMLAEVVYSGHRPDVNQETLDEFDAQALALTSLPALTCRVH